MHSLNKNGQTAFILTLVFPFAGLIYTLSRWREEWARNAFWLVCVYMGAVLVYCPEGTILGMGGDGGRYVLQLMDMYNSPSMTIGSILALYQRDPQIMDLYQPLLTFFVSRFTDNGHVLFAVFAFVFGYFYSRNIWYILDKLPNKRLGNLFIIVALYFFICPITQINGVRMWTALHMYVYGMMPYLLEKDKSKIWWIFVTPLIHFSFLYVAIFGVIWLLIPYRTKASSLIFIHVAFVFFIVTLFINSININVASNVLEEYAPESYGERLGNYINEDYIADRTAREANHNWRIVLSGNLIYWSYTWLFITILPCLIRNFRSNKGLMNLSVFAFVLSGIANLMALLPSGGRFQLLSQMFKVPLFLMVAMLVPLNDSYRKYVNIAMILLFFPFVFEIRKLFDYYSITVLFGNFITMFFWENNVLLIDLIKHIV